MRVAVIVLAAGALAACGTSRTARVEPAPTPAPVVAVAPPVVAPPPPVRPPPGRLCVPRTLGPAPRYPDTDAALRAAPGAADRYQLLAAGRLQRQRRLEELERIIAGCRGATLNAP